MCWGGSGIQLWVQPTDPGALGLKLKPTGSRVLVVNVSESGSPKYLSTVTIK